MKTKAFLIPLILTCSALGCQLEGILECPTGSLKSEPGICGCNVEDIDTDGDGTYDCQENCPLDQNKFDPGVCGCGQPDVDSDGDGVFDCMDPCPTNANRSKGTCDCAYEKDDPGVCGCDKQDIDSDNDSVLDCNDICPLNAQKTDEGACGCDMQDIDTDGDTTPDCKEDCPYDSGKTSPGICGCGVPDVDNNGDGKIDCVDLCPENPLKNAPGLCGCDTLDTDSDGDTTPDCKDECKNDKNKTTKGACGCDQLDTDTDGDTTPDCIDECKNDKNKTTKGACGCDQLDTDTDGDTTPDCIDKCETDKNKTTKGACGCNQVETDTDGDTTPDCIDECPNNPNLKKLGECGCGKKIQIMAEAEKVCSCTVDGKDVCGCDSAILFPGRKTDSDDDKIDDCKDPCPEDESNICTIPKCKDTTKLACGNQCFGKQATALVYGKADLYINNSTKYGSIEKYTELDVYGLSQSAYGEYYVVLYDDQRLYISKNAKLFFYDVDGTINEPEKVTLRKTSEVDPDNVITTLEDKTEITIHRYEDVNHPPINSNTDISDYGWFYILKPRPGYVAAEFVSLSKGSDPDISSCKE